MILLAPTSHRYLGIIIWAIQKGWNTDYLRIPGDAHLLVIQVMTDQLFDVPDIRALNIRATFESQCDEFILIVARRS